MYNCFDLKKDKVKKVTTYGEIINGKIHYTWLSKFKQSVLSTFKEKERFLVSYEKIYKKRSSNQNAYYHGIVVSSFLEGVKQEWGEDHSHDWGHEQLKQYCNFTEKLIKSTGEIVKISQTTTKLTTIEFMEYIDRCILLIGEWFGIVVLPPNTQSEINYK